MNEIIQFFQDNLILSLLIGIPIGLIILAKILGFILNLIPDAKVKADPDFSTEDQRANDLALGFIQIRTAMGVWNDPEAREIAKSKSLKKNLASMWGLHTSADYQATIKRLVEDRRSRELWDSLLAVRMEAAKELGRKPTEREWLDAVKSEGGTGKGEEKDFIKAVHYYEKKLRKSGKTIVFPDDAVVTNLEGYAFGQAVAVAVWGVAMEIATVDEATKIIRNINKIARKRFDSWEDFGRSYILGRALHQSDGKIDDELATKMGDAQIEYAAALNEKIDGPWTRLKW